MQEVSGACLTEPNGVALTSIATVLQQGLLLSPTNYPQIRSIARRAEAPDRHSSVRCRHAPPAYAYGIRATKCQTGVAPDCGLRSYDDSLFVHLSSAASKRSDRRINVGNSSLSIASERWIIRASPDGLQ